MATIILDNLANGQEIVLNYTVTGSATPASGQSIDSMKWQVDDHQQHDIPSPFDSFSFEITAADMPDVNTWYTVNVYTWESPSGNNTTRSVSVKRVSPSRT